MTIFDLYSKRQKRLRGEVPDVFTYDEIPQTLRVQIVHILRESLGDEDDYKENAGRVLLCYKTIVDILCREYGVFLLEGMGGSYISQLFYFLVNEKNYEKVLDAIELCFKSVDDVLRDYGYRENEYSKEIADSAIKELNQRFLEHGIDYQYTNGEIIRIDSTFTHKEIVLLTLSLQHVKEYKGVEEEFLKAHEHYRNGNDKEAINEALKSFESMMKVVCDKKGWRYPTNATAKSLIDVLFNNGLIDPFWNSHFSALRSLLESGVPTGRNKLGGHGQGGKPVTVPKHITGFIINMTASCILSLGESAK